MTKHIAGLIMFSLIVGTSVFISALTSAERSVDVTVYDVAVTKKKKRKRKKRRCRPHRRDFQVSLQKVVFDRKTGLLSTSFSEPSASEAAGSVELHFYSKDVHGTRFLKTESLGYGGLEEKQFKSLDWLTRIDEGQNIYVLATVKQHPSRWSVPPRFDPIRAVPLLVSSE